MHLTNTTEDLVLCLNDYRENQNDNAASNIPSIENGQAGGSTTTTDTTTTPTATITSVVPFPAFSREIGAAARRFHASIPNYAPTPLVSLRQLAKQINVGEVSLEE